MVNGPLFLKLKTSNLLILQSLKPFFFFSLIFSTHTITDLAQNQNQDMDEFSNHISCNYVVTCITTVLPLSERLANRKVDVKQTCKHEFEFFFLFYGKLKKYNFENHRCLHSSEEGEAGIRRNRKQR